MGGKQLQPPDDPPTHALNLLLCCARCYLLCRAVLRGAQEQLDAVLSAKAAQESAAAPSPSPPAPRDGPDAATASAAQVRPVGHATTVHKAAWGAWLFLHGPCAAGGPAWPLAGPLPSSVLGSPHLAAYGTRLTNLTVLRRLASATCFMG